LAAAAKLLAVLLVVFESCETIVYIEYVSASVTIE